MTTSWHLLDSLVLAVLLLLLHQDRFVLDTWRFLDFERTFFYAFDSESFFTYPLFLYPVGLLISPKTALRDTLSTGVPLWTLRLTILISYLVSFDYLYRLRLLLSVCLMFSAASLAVATCFGLAQRHQQRQWDENVRRKVERKRRKQEMMGASVASAGAAPQKRQWMEDFEIPKEAMTAKVPEKPVESSESMGSSSEADEAETSLATSNTVK